MDPRTVGLHKSCLGACVMTDAEFYTSVAETIDPVSAVDFINRYFALLFRPVFDHGGFVSDLKGDGMLALWTDGASALELRRRVCLACLQMAESGLQFSRTHGMRGYSTRVGACFGPLALATVGTAAHSEYRAVGDTVNTSSRLEQLNKDLGTRILVCANVAQGLDEFLFRDLGPFQLRGKLNRVHVYELVALAAAATDSQRRLCAEFGAALAAYQHSRLTEAEERLKALCARYPGDGPSRFYLMRCQQGIADRAHSAVRFADGTAAPARAYS
jgi:adenylate cyclase